jgi:hypothetical protein
MTDCNAIPSAVERIAAVEAKRGAKDIKQVAKVRWPAIVRVREREAKAGSGNELVEVEGAISLEKYVRAVRRRKDDPSEFLVPDFIRVAGYQILRGELPLHAQVAALREAKGKLSKHAENMIKTLKIGIDARIGVELSLHEKEQVSKRKLDTTVEISQLQRSILHFKSYLEEFTPERRAEMERDPVGWFDLVRALHLNV